MTMKKLFLCILFFLGALPALYSQPSSVDEALTLDECIAISLDQNPLIHSSYEQHQASLARVFQARAFPQPAINIDSDLQPKFLGLRDSTESYFGISQTFLFPGKQRVRAKIATQESLEIQADIDLLKLDIAFQVRQAFFGLLLAQELLKYAEQDRELAQDFLNKAELRNKAGDVAQVEVLRARVEASKAANIVKSASNEINLARAKLNFLLARNKYDPLKIKGDFARIPLGVILEDLRQMALTNRPEMKKINFSIEKAGFKKTEGYLGYLPDFDLGISRHRLEGQKTTWDFTLSFPIPLFFWQPKKGEIAEAEANLRSLKKEYEHLRNVIYLEVEEAYVNALTASQQIQLFEGEILSQAEEVYNMFFFSYQEGEIGGIELIEARRTLIEARKSYADSLCNSSVALAALEKSVGRKLRGGDNE